MGVFKEFLSLQKIQFMFVELLKLANNHIHVLKLLAKTYSDFLKTWNWAAPSGARLAARQ